VAAQPHRTRYEPLAAVPAALADGSTPPLKRSTTRWLCVLVQLTTAPAHPCPARFERRHVREDCYAPPCPARTRLVHVLSIGHVVCHREHADVNAPRRSAARGDGPPCNQPGILRRSSEQARHHSPAYPLCSFLRGSERPA